MLVWPARYRLPPRYRSGQPAAYDGWLSSAAALALISMAGLKPPELTSADVSHVRAVN